MRKKEYRKLYPIMQYDLTIPDRIVDEDQAKAAIESLVRSRGWSPVSYPTIHLGYNVDENKWRSLITVRYIEHPGLEIIIPDSARDIEVTTDGESPNH